jgi:hypothetical protein
MAAWGVRRWAGCWEGEGKREGEVGVRARGAVLVPAGCAPRRRPGPAAAAAAAAAHRVGGVLRGGDHRVRLARLAARQVDHLLGLRAAAVLLVAVVQHHLGRREKGRGEAGERAGVSRRVGRPSAAAARPSWPSWPGGPSRLPSAAHLRPPLARRLLPAPGAAAGPALAARLGLGAAPAALLGGRTGARAGPARRRAVVAWAGGAQGAAAGVSGCQSRAHPPHRPEAQHCSRAQAVRPGRAAPPGWRPRRVQLPGAACAARAAAPSGSPTRVAGGHRAHERRRLVVEAPPLAARLVADVRHVVPVAAQGV